MAVKITVDGTEATNSVKNFKKEIKLAEQDLLKMSATFGATSKQAIEAAKRVANLKDEIGDAKQLVDAFNPDTKFRAFGSAIQTAVGGFTALQGVMGLVGVESAEVEKTLLKVQSALAISQGFSQFQEGLSTFKNLGAVIQSTTIFQKANAAATAIAGAAMRLFGVNTTVTATAMTRLKVAIAATGIGVLVIGLVAVADAMGLFADETEDATEKQKDLEDQLKLTNAALAAETSFLANEEKLELARARNAGKSAKDIYDIQQKYRELNFNAEKRKYDQIADKDSEEAVKSLARLNSINNDGRIARLDFETQTNKELEQKRKEHQDKLDKIAKDAAAQRLKEAQEDAARRNANFAATGGPGAGLNIAIPKTIEQLQLEQETAARFEARRIREELQARTISDDATVTAILKRRKDERVADAEKEYQSRKALLEATGTALGALASLIGQQTAAGKILAIAQATINTFVGATEVLRSPSVLPEPIATISKIANVAAIIATGFAAVKNITKTQVPGAGGAAGGALSQPPPLTPQRPEQQTTQLDQQSINALGSATTRAFVLESDITNNQERVTRLNRAARIGG